MADGCGNASGRVCGSLLCNKNMRKGEITIICVCGWLYIQTRRNLADLH